MTTHTTDTARRPTLIVAEDDADLRATLIDLLLADGHDVEWEGCGAGLLSRLARQPDPSLVVTDLRMPWLDGLEVLERAARMGLHVPGILCTGHLSHDVRQRARTLHVPVLPKPLDIPALRHEIRTGLSEAEFWSAPEHDGYTEIRRRPPQS